MKIYQAVDPQGMRIRFVASVDIHVEPGQRTIATPDADLRIATLDGERILVLPYGVMAFRE